MRYVLAFVLVLTMVGAAVANDLGNVMPEKTDVYPDYVNPDLRQGGDTMADATAIAIPGNDAGTTAGYNDDYDEACPYTISTSPDVVYTTTPAGDVTVDIDLLGSTYDTKLYVYDADMNLIGCNDDFYPDYVSKLENVNLMGGVQYFIIVDGYGGSSGDYVIGITEGAGPCDLVCPPEGVLEGEPDLVEDYDDTYNGGCNADNQAFQDMNAFGAAFIEFCGVSGWYTFTGLDYRDTDWFVATIGEMGFIEITADAELPLWIPSINGDCNNLVIGDDITVGPCAPDVLTLFGAPGELVYFICLPPTWEAPAMFDYILTIDGLEGSATEASTWSQVKGLYR